jgi:pilus assembly protein Flp/PilA
MNPCIVRNQRGQGLIEYLIIVALMGVGTIVMVRVMGEAVNSRFASVTHALQGEKFSKKVTIDSGALKKKDLGNFFNGVGGSGSGSGASSGDDSSDDGE